MRLLPSESYGAALQYFTGSKAHNVSLRQRALKMGYTLSEWSLARLDDESVVAAATEEDIYAALGMDWMQPEMRENLGEIEAAAHHTLPKLIELNDIRGDVHMHTTATDGHNSIREMADAALARGYQYIAITDHSKNLAMTNGLDDKRALEHIKRIREVDAEMEGKIRIFPGIEVDILADGALDLDNETLAQMEIVIASVHTRLDQPREEMTARVLRALENPYTRILGHSHRPPAPAPRALRHRHRRRPPPRRRARRRRRTQRRARAPRPERPRPAPRQGNRLQDCHQHRRPRHPPPRQNDLRPPQLKRAWLGPQDVLNTRGTDEFLAALRPRP